MKKKKAIVYVDGLNLYYGLLKKTEFKRLDIHRLVSLLLEDQWIKIVALKYFCARMPADSHDEQVPIRQDTYLRALEKYTKKSCRFELIEWHFKTGVIKRGMLLPGKKKIGRISTNEEKWTDVNIGVHIVNDAHTKIYDVTCLISNDTDLSEALRMASYTGKEIYLIPPIRRYTKTEMKQFNGWWRNMPQPSGKLTQYADRHASGGISKTKLKQSQLPQSFGWLVKPEVR